MEVQIALSDFLGSLVEDGQGLFDFPVVKPPGVRQERQGGRDDKGAQGDLPHVFVEKPQGPRRDKQSGGGGFDGVNLPGVRVHIGVGHGGLHVEDGAVWGNGVVFSRFAFVGVVGGDVLEVQGVPGPFQPPALQRDEEKSAQSAQHRGEHQRPPQGYTLAPGYLFLSVFLDCYLHCHLYPTPQMVAILSPQPAAVSLARMRRMCSATTELSPSLSQPHTDS